MGFRTPQLVIKRGMDITIAAAALILTAPVMIWVALAAVVAQGPPVFFRQARPGLHGREFTMIKFRTMRAPRDGEVWALTDAQRVTRLGTLLRTTSLDELPELWNVLRGEMSLVGPRPLLVEYMDQYTPEQHLRHEMKPGVTGLAVVRGRNSLPYEDRVALDVWYVTHWSLALDVRILLETIGQVLSRSDAAIVEDLDALGFPEFIPRKKADDSET